MHRVDPERWLTEFEELTGADRGRFARVEPRRRDAGRVENCHAGVFLGYASAAGHAHLKALQLAASSLAETRARAAAGLVLGSGLAGGHGMPRPGAG